MSRTARKQSSSGIYHVMIRGNEKKDIFCDDCDRKRFLEIVLKVKERSKYTLYAYCLMKNHVHMLIKEEGGTIHRVMKCIQVRYAIYFNRKYERIGHLFQDRFRSEAVETDQYLLLAARYIHNNPIKAGITKKPSDYMWSSFNSYFTDDLNNLIIIDRDYLMGIFSDNRKSAEKQFLEFSSLSDEDTFMDYSDNDRQDPIENKGFELMNITKKYGMELTDLKKCPDKKLRNLILNDIKRNINISIRELSNITGIGKGIISRC